MQHYKMQQAELCRTGLTAMCCLSDCKCMKSKHPDQKYRCIGSSNALGFRVVTCSITDVGV